MELVTNLTFNDKHNDSTGIYSCNKRQRDAAHVHSHIHVFDIQRTVHRDIFL